MIQRTNDINAIFYIFATSHITFICLISFAQINLPSTTDSVKDGLEDAKKFDSGVLPVPEYANAQAELPGDSRSGTVILKSGALAGLEPAGNDASSLSGAAVSTAVTSPIMLRAKFALERRASVRRQSLDLALISDMPTVGTPRSRKQSSNLAASVVRSDNYAALDEHPIMSRLGL